MGHGSKRNREPMTLQTASALFYIVVAVVTVLVGLYLFHRLNLGRPRGTARQREDWEEVAGLGDRVFTLGDRPNDASERLPLIEGYAHVGRWEMAVELSLEMVEEQPPMVLAVCRTWSRLEDSVPDGPGRQDALEKIEQALSCDEVRI